MAKTGRGVKGIRQGGVTEGGGELVVAEKSKGFLATTAQVWEDNGLKGFYQGVVPSLAGGH